MQCAVSDLESAYSRALHSIPRVGTGDIYFWDFGSDSAALPAPSLIYQAMAGDSDDTAFALVDAAEKAGVRVAGTGPAIKTDDSKAPAMSDTEAAAAAVMAVAAGAAGEEKRRADALGSSRFGSFLGKTLFDRRVDGGAVEEHRLREQLHAALHASYDPLLGTSLTTAPRQLRVTFDIALSLGIDIVREPEYLWLADLAQSMPVPLGWAIVDHPIAQQPSFWHNELSQISQWQHPVDDYIKSLVLALRTPLNPRSAPLVRVMLGEGAAGGGQ